METTALVSIFGDEVNEEDESSNNVDYKIARGGINDEEVRQKKL